MLSADKQRPSSHSPDDEPDLLAAIQETLAGNSAAFRLIVETYSPPLFALAMRMLGNREDAEEALQEIFLKVFGALKNFRLGNRLLPWVYTIALNYLRSVHRKKTRRHETEIKMAHDSVVSGLADHSRPDPGENAVLAIAEETAAQALHNLRPDYRAVFILRAIEGWPVSEIASMMNIPEGTVKTFLFRARAALAKIILDG